LLPKQHNLALASGEVLMLLTLETLETLEPLEFLTLRVDGQLGKEDLPLLVNEVTMAKSSRSSRISNGVEDWLRFAFASSERARGGGESAGSRVPSVAGVGVFWDPLHMLPGTLIRSKSGRKQ
jgi:hypothetical protein